MSRKQKRHDHDERDLATIRIELRATLARRSTALSQQLEARGDYAGALRALSLAARLFGFEGRWLP
jgi:hypothetical protein